MTGDERDRDWDRHTDLDLDQDIEAKLRLVIEVLRDTVSDIAKSKEAQEAAEAAGAQEAAEAESFEAVETQPPKASNASKASKASKKKKPNVRRALFAEGAVEEAKKLNVHVSRLHSELMEQTETARRERCLREKVERRIESIIEEMRDMRATHKYDLAALNAALVEANTSRDASRDASRDDGIHDIVFDATRVAEKERCELASTSASSSLVSLIYDESVRTTSSIAALDGGSMGEDDARAMRVFCDMQCTASVLDPHGMLCGLMHVTCPVTAMRGWVVSRNMVDIIAVREIRADPTSERARGAFTAAMLRRASSTTLGAMVIERGPGKHGNVRVATNAARRCRLEARPDEMLAWLVRARARSVLDLGLDLDLAGGGRGPA